MDDFAKAAAESWEALINIISNFRIQEKEKQNIRSEIEKCSLYLKTSYALHCNSSSECICVRQN